MPTGSYKKRDLLNGRSISFSAYTLRMAVEYGDYTSKESSKSISGGWYCALRLCELLGRS